MEYDPKTPLATEIFMNCNLDKSLLLDRCWVPLSWDENGIIVLVDDPSSFQKMQQIMTALDTKRIILAVGIKEDIHAFINRAFQELQASDAFSKAMSGDSSVDVQKLVDLVIAEAYLKGASDIHFESSAVRKDHRVRFRVGGVCQEYGTLPEAVGRDAVRRIKAMANLDPENRGLPQNGLMKFAGKDNDLPEFMLQVTTYPTGGLLEDAVLRILTALGPMSLEALLLSGSNFELLKRTLLKPYGLLIAAGGPGSGKLTLLHTMLHYINKPGLKVVTAEYPLEIRRPDIGQLEADPDKGLTFPKAIRCLMKADPDVIMVSAMDDPKTAELCLEAALRGFFVLSAVTAATAPDAVEMLLDFGLQPIKLSDGLLGVIAQKLVRKLCIHCMEQYHPSKADFNRMVAELGAEQAESNGIHYRDDLLLYHRTGCDKCFGSGFDGRTPINELLDATPLIKSLIRKKSLVDADMIRECAARQGMSTFQEDGILKILQGLTDIDELKRVIAQ
jgi:type II secretory ATPase GspE/PulE/Tfp pilus assembly ATPase PilB-like protein